MDLGHRYAAACAVWETVNVEQVKAACQSASHRVPMDGDLYLHLKDEKRTVIYRRIGADLLPDGKPHPAPWARLDRQFFIKLQGEERPARAASSEPAHGVNETAMIANLTQALGLRGEDADAAKGRGVDELMRRAVRIATRGLKRHGRRAKIAYAFKPDCPGIPNGRHAESHHAGG